MPHPCRRDSRTRAAATTHPGGRDSPAPAAATHVAHQVGPRTAASGRSGPHLAANRQPGFAIDAPGESRQGGAAG